MVFHLVVFFLHLNQFISAATASWLHRSQSYTHTAHSKNISIALKSHKIILWFVTNMGEWWFSSFDLQISYNTYNDTCTHKHTHHTNSRDDDIFLSLFFYSVWQCFYAHALLKFTFRWTSNTLIKSIGFCFEHKVNRTLKMDNGRGLVNLLVVCCKPASTSRKKIKMTKQPAKWTYVRATTTKKHSSEFDSFHTHLLHLVHCLYGFLFFFLYTIINKLSVCQLMIN